MVNFEKFIEFVKSECKKHKVHFKEYKRKYIKLSDSIKCGGFFASGDDDGFEKPTLAYSKGNTDSMSLLVHEYGHMTQWLDTSSVWSKSTQSLGYLDEWLAGNEIDDISKHIDIALELELDNEKRSVELIKQWNLPLDIPTYIKKANAYLQFYLYLKESRKWSVPGRAPYSIEEIVNEMSDKFDMNYTYLEPKIRNLFVYYKI